MARTQRVLLIALDRGRKDTWPLEDRLAELAELVRTAGGEVVGTVVQVRSEADSATWLGRGKAVEAGETARRLGADLIVADEELSPAQRRNLEFLLGFGVVDRSQLILDIFAQRAQSREGKIQVELAQLRYLLPRLTGKGEALSRLGGGIGTRGPGETKLETDRRRIRHRIRELEHALHKVRRHRQVVRRGRSLHGRPVAALVGYTNAGKSTLLRSLSGADTWVEDRLFATLDPKTRAVKLPGGFELLLTDTVGFIQGLPHPLIAAFRATLEETLAADLLVHVVDCSHPRADEMIATVHSVLRDLGAEEKTTITVLNKVDRLTREGKRIPPHLLRLPQAVAVSALTGEGLEDLKHTLDRLLAQTCLRLRIELPFGRMDLLDLIFRRGRVHQTTYSSRGVEVVADLDRTHAEKIYKQLPEPLRKTMQPYGSPDPNPVEA